MRAAYLKAFLTH
jgi:hypothetical protein